MKDYMDPRNWDAEDIEACKYWSLGAALTLTLAYTMIWILY